MNKPVKLLLIAASLIVLILIFAINILIKKYEKEAVPSAVNQVEPVKTIKYEPVTKPESSNEPEVEQPVGQGQLLN